MVFVISDEGFYICMLWILMVCVMSQRGIKGVMVFPRHAVGQAMTFYAMFDATEHCGDCHISAYLAQHQTHQVFYW